MNRHVILVLALYLTAVFVYSVMEITHDILHLLAKQSHSHFHDHRHHGHHHLHDHQKHLSHHKHDHNLHKQALPFKERILVFYPLSFLEQKPTFNFYASYRLSNLAFIIDHLSAFIKMPATPPPR